MPITGTFGGFPFDPEVYQGFVDQEATFSDSILASGILANDQSMASALDNGGVQGTIRFYNPLDPDQDAPLVRDGVADNVPTEISGGKQSWIRIDRMKAWKATELTRELTAADPMAAVARNTGRYWRMYKQGLLVKLVNEIKGFGDSAEKPKGLGGLFWNAKKAVSDMQTKYDKVEVNVDAIASSLEGYQVQLLKDISLFNHLYDMNTEYFKELTMYILAGEKRLAEVRRTTLEELKARAAQSGDAMDAQRANDMAANCDRFEKKLHDLKLTRQVALQMAPQIRLLQNNDSLLVERIQSTLSNTLPLWKSQIVIALGLHRSQEALKAQTAVTDMTNELLRKNAAALKTGTIETAREAERGILDLNTLVETNQSLIDTISEVMKIQDEGRAQRVEAEKQLVTMENELKQKLLELKH